MLWYSRYGIDFTDEGFYLVWMPNPYRCSGSVTQYKFIYHPIYLLLDGNVAALRQFNIFFTYVLAWTLSCVFLRAIFAPSAFGKARLAVIAAALATPSMLFLTASLVSCPGITGISLAYRCGIFGTEVPR